MQERLENAGDGARADVDTGLLALVTLLALYDVAADPAQLQREFAPHGQPMAPFDIIAAARARGLKARLTRSSVERLSALPLPAIARACDGRYFILAKTSESAVLVKEGTAAPAEWTHEEFKDRWSGEVEIGKANANKAETHACCNERDRARSWYLVIDSTSAPPYIRSFAIRLEHREMDEQDACLQGSGRSRLRF